MERTTRKPAPTTLTATDFYLQIANAGRQVRTATKHGNHEWADSWRREQAALQALAESHGIDPMDGRPADD